MVFENLHGCILRFSDRFIIADTDDEIRAPVGAACIVEQVAFVHGGIGNLYNGPTQSHQDGYPDGQRLDIPQYAVNFNQVVGMKWVL